MKKKLGPLPLWAWVLIAGGTIGIIWYLRTPSSATAAATTTPLDTTLPDTTGALDASTGGGGSGVTDPTLTAPTSTTTLDDVMSSLMGLSGDVAALQGGGQGLTDEPAPVATFAGEVTDVTTGVQALSSLATLFAPPAAKKTTAQKKTTAAKKKSNGSGNAGKAAKTHKTPVRHTRKHVAAKKPARRPAHPAVGHVVVTPTHHTTGGNAQHHRTARPKKKVKR